MDELSIALEAEVVRRLTAAGAVKVEVYTVVKVITTVRDKSEREGIYKVEMELLEEHRTVPFAFRCKVEE